MEEISAFATEQARQYVNRIVLTIVKIINQLRKRSVSKMNDKKLTDAEIVNALGRLSCKTLNDCKLINAALDLINRLQEENENLYKTINNMDSSVGKINEKLPLIKAEAYKEFAEKVKAYPCNPIYKLEIYKLLKEMEGAE